MSDISMTANEHAKIEPLRQRIRELEDVLQASEANARAFQEKLKALHEVNSILNQVSGFNELCRQAIILGRARLGFDRMGLLMLSEDGTQVLGTWGTDPQGQLRDEHDLRLTIDQDDYLSQARRNHDRVSVWQEKNLGDYGHVIGTGWGIIAPLYEHERTLGWLAVDNLITRAPMLLFQPELLAHFGAALAQLIRRLRAEEALRSQEAYSRAMLQAIPDLIVRMRADGTFLDVKPGATVVPIMEAAEVVGRNLSEIMSPALVEASLVRIRRAIETGTTQTSDYGLTVEGKKRTYEARTVALTDDEVVTVIRDVTDQREALNRSLQLAVQQERMRLLSNFITKASHEFRTPLSVIGVNTYLAEKTAEPQRRLEALHAIQDQAQTLNRLVEGLLTVMRLDWTDSLAEHSINLVYMLNDISRKALARCLAAGMTYSSDLAPSLPPVRGNIARLTQAFNELLDNAVRFSRSGDHIMLHSVLDGDHIVITLTDTGIGISAEQMPHIFEQFYRADPSHSTRGLGLGLSIAQRIIELHDGHIEIESEPGTGTTLRVVLPVHAGAAS